MIILLLLILLDVSISFADFMQYVGYLMGGLAIWQLQRIIIKIGEVVKDVSLFKQWQQTAQKTLDEHDNTIDKVKEKVTEHEGKISEIQRKVL